jgi:hypothetical protein
MTMGVQVGCKAEVIPVRGSQALVIAFGFAHSI